MYQNAEDSMETGSPFTLYEIVTGPNPADVFRYTDGDVDYDWDGDIFYRTAISRSELQSDGTLSKASMDVKLPKKTPVPQMFANYPPSYVVIIRIWEAHVDDRQSQKNTVFAGRVLNCKNVGQEATLLCEPASTAVKRPALRRHYQKACPLVLYGEGTGQCNAAKTPFGGNVESASGNVMSIRFTSLPAPAEQFANGVVQWQNPDTLRTEIRSILSATAAGNLLTCTLSGPVNSDPLSAIVLKGCDHTETACANWHNNVVNYGGQLWIPLESPFGTTATFY